MSMQLVVTGHLCSSHANRIQKFPCSLDALPRASEAETDEVNLKLMPQVLDALLVLVCHDRQIILHIVQRVLAPFSVEDCH